MVALGFPPDRFHCRSPVGQILERKRNMLISNAISVDRIGPEGKGRMRLQRSKEKGRPEGRPFPNR